MSKTVIKEHLRLAIDHLINEDKEKASSAVQAAMYEIARKRVVSEDTELDFNAPLKGADLEVDDETVDTELELDDSTDDDITGEDLDDQLNFDSEDLEDLDSLEDLVDLLKKHGLEIAPSEDPVEDDDLDGDDEEDDMVADPDVGSEIDSDLDLESEDDVDPDYKFNQ